MARNDKKLNKTIDLLETSPLDLPYMVEPDQLAARVMREKREEKARKLEEKYRQKGTEEFQFKKGRTGKWYKVSGKKVGRPRTVRDEDDNSWEMLGILMGKNDLSRLRNFCYIRGVEVQEVIRAFARMICRDTPVELEKAIEDWRDKQFVEWLAWKEKRDGRKLGMLEAMELYSMARELGLDSDGKMIFGREEQNEQSEKGSREAKDGGQERGVRAVCNTAADQGAGSVAYGLYEAGDLQHRGSYSGSDAGLDGAGGAGEFIGGGIIDMGELLSSARQLALGGGASSGEGKTPDSDAAEGAKEVGESPGEGREAEGNQGEGVEAGVGV